MSNGRLAGPTERKTKDMSDRLKAEREAAVARRNLLTQDAIERTGITEEMIGELVTRFYGRVREMRCWDRCSRSCRTGTSISPSSEISGRRSS